MAMDLKEAAPSGAPRSSVSRKSWEIGLKKHQSIVTRSALLNTRGFNPFTVEKSNSLSLQPSIYVIPIIIPFSTPPEILKSTATWMEMDCNERTAKGLALFTIAVGYLLMLLNLFVQGGFVYYVGVILDSTDISCGRAAPYLQYIAVTTYSSFFVEDLFQSIALTLWLIMFPRSKKPMELLIQDDLDLLRGIDEIAREQLEKTSANESLCSLTRMTVSLAEIDVARSEYIKDMLSVAGWDIKSKHFAEKSCSSSVSVGVRQKKLWTLGKFVSHVDQSRKDLVANPELNTTRIVSGMQRSFKVAMFFSVVTPKIAIAALLASYGGGFLLTSQDNETLILNTLAITFIIELDEKFYDIFVPYQVKNVIEELPPLQVNFGHGVWSLGAHVVPVLKLICSAAAGTVLFTFACTGPRGS